MKDKTLTTLKLIAVGSTLIYLYHHYKKNGQSMAGKYSPDAIAHLAAQLVPVNYRQQAKQFGTVVLNRFIQ